MCIIAYKILFPARWHQDRKFWWSRFDFVAVFLRQCHFQDLPFYYLKSRSITSAKSFRPGSRVRLRALEAHGFLGALWCNLSLIFLHYSKTLTKFSLKKIKKKKKKKKNIFWQEKTYCRIFLKKHTKYSVSAKKIYDKCPKSEKGENLRTKICAYIEICSVYFPLFKTTPSFF